MSAIRKFLGWNQPVMPAAARILCELHRLPHGIDLNNALIVVSGSRTARSLLEQLVLTADEQQVPLLPPRIVTPGQIPEHLYTQRKPFASTLVQQLAWSQALKQHRDVSKYIPHHPESDDALGWMAFGAQVEQQFMALTAEGKDFSDVVASFARSQRTSEKQRWQFLGGVQASYLAVLDGMGLCDRHYARRDALRHKACRTDREIYCVAVADLDGGVREMLRMLGSRVTALIAAPDTMSDRFDDIGCVLPAAWADLPNSLRDDQIVRVNGPRDQARAVVDQLARWSESFALTEMGIAVPDPELVRELERELLECEIPHRWWIRKPLRETGPYRLLEVVARYLEEPRYTDFAHLLRHPDIEAWLVPDETNMVHLQEADRYHSEHLPWQVGAWLGRPSDRQTVEAAYQQLEAALEGLRASSARLSVWAERIHAFLMLVYGSRTLDTSQADEADLAESLTLVSELLTDLRRIPSALEFPTPGANALRVILRQLTQKTLTAEPNASALELLGWLDAPFASHAATIITSMNEGFVPTSVNGDHFLPESLRTKLGITDNQRRLARDAYHLELLLQSRQSVYVVVPQRDSTGNPRVPSRLIFRSDDETVARRGSNLFADIHSTPQSIDWLAPDVTPPEVSNLCVPIPQKRHEPLTTMSVTSFRDYLNCPYRFYLRHILQLQSSQDELEELPPHLFGTVIHDVLQRFGESPAKQLADPAAIREFLRDTLSDVSFQRFGPQRLPAVEIQLTVITHRLNRFAEWQAERTRDGWQIEFVELACQPDQHQLTLDQGVAMGLRGRIDRIDWHPDSDQWEVLDYKTSDQMKSPEVVHRRNRQWTDLQLPLYRHILSKLPLPLEQTQFGFVVMPKDPTQFGRSLANWQEHEWREALTVAHEVALKVHRQVFWPPTVDPRFDPPEYSALCRQRLPDLDADASRGAARSL